MKILITGGDGQLGRALKKILPKNEAIFVDRGDFDIVDPVAVKQFFQKVKPELVIHTAAFTDVDSAEKELDLAFKINEDGTKNITENCQKIGANLVYISTDYVFDGRKKTPYKETDKPRPLSVYGASKLAGEKQIQKFFKNFYIIRTSWLYGEGKNFVRTILKLANEKEELKIVADQIGSPTYTLDLAEAIWSLVQKKAKFGFYHFSNSGQCSWYQLAGKIIKLAGPKAKIIPITSEDWQKIKPDSAQRPNYSVLAKDKIQKLRIKPRDWQMALKDYLKNKSNFIN